MFGVRTFAKISRFEHIFRSVRARALVADLHECVQKESDDLAGYRHIEWSMWANTNVLYKK